MNSLDRSRYARESGGRRRPLAGQRRPLLGPFRVLVGATAAGAILFLGAGVGTAGSAGEPVPVFDPGAESLDPGTAALDPGADPFDPGAESLDPWAESLDPGAESFDPGAASDPPVPARLGEWTDRSAFSDAHAPFAVSVGDVEIPYRLMAVAVLPGEVLQVEAEAVGTGNALILLDEEGVVEEVAPGRWEWEVPDEPGIRALRVEAAPSGAIGPHPAGPVDPAGDVDPAEVVGSADAVHAADAVHLNVLVMHPRASKRGEALNGYRIGRYLDPGPRGNPLHQPPVGFVEVGPEEESILVSPHFTLGQFVSHQPGNPRYIAYSEPLIMKLEAILEAVNEAGYETPTFHVMSAFRTPHYNRAIGNTTTVSRHLWGDAADIFIDTTGDGRMDDLNGDGRVDEADARILYDIVESVERNGSSHVEVGGLGLYRPNAVRGPFVHVDARGHPARW